MRSMLLANSHIRAMDRFFESAVGRNLSPFAVMDKVLDSITTPIPPEETPPRILTFHLFLPLPELYYVGLTHYWEREWSPIWKKHFEQIRRSW